MTKIIVSQGMCSPIRGQVLTLFDPYGFKRLRVESYALTESGRRGQDGVGYVDNEPVQCNVAEIHVSPQAARWAEYLICRSGKFLLMSQPIDPRNEVWAAKWKHLPPAWRQSGCKAPAAKPAPKKKRRSFWGIFDW